MYTLIINGQEIAVSNFKRNSGYYELYIECKNKQMFFEFLHFFDNYKLGNGTFDIAFDGKDFLGSFAASIEYDTNYNVCVNLLEHTEDDDLFDCESRKVYDLNTSVIGIRNSIRDLLNILCEKEVINTEQVENLIETMHTPETLPEFHYLVSKLHFDL